MLRIAGLRVAYGEREVLTGVDLTVGTGEVVGLVGPNGCGKTTLLRAITRVVPWVSGEVVIDGLSTSPSTGSGRGPSSDGPMLMLNLSTRSRSAPAG